MNESLLSGVFLCGNFPTPGNCKGGRADGGLCLLLSPSFPQPLPSPSINVCNHILELLCDFKVHLFRAAQTLIIPAVISKIIKYGSLIYLGSGHDSPRDMSSSSKLMRSGWYTTRTTSAWPVFSLKETEHTTPIYWLNLSIYDQLFVPKNHQTKAEILPSEGNCT